MPHTRTSVVEAEQSDLASRACLHSRAVCGTLPDSFFDWSRTYKRFKVTGYCRKNCELFPMGVFWILPLVGACRCLSSAEGLSQISLRKKQTATTKQCHWRPNSAASSAQ